MNLLSLLVGEPFSKVSALWSAKAIVGPPGGIGASAHAVSAPILEVARAVKLPGDSLEIAEILTDSGQNFEVVHRRD